MSVKDTGSITFWARHDHPDWPTNSNRYNFGPFTAEGITVNATKHGNGVAEFVIEGPLGREFVIKTSMPRSEERRLFVAITWDSAAVELYLNGQLVERVTT